MADTVRTAAVAALALVAAFAGACSTETDFTIVAQGENDEGEVVPLTNVSLDVLPYDIDDLYEELEAQTQPGPPPPADSLGVLARVYQESCAAYRATSDSIETVRQRATQVQQQEGEASDAYRQAFAQYQALVQREEQRFDRCQEVTDVYTGVRSQYRQERTAWEERAWPAGDFASAESLRVGDSPIQTVETDQRGVATVTVPNGDWWILGTAPVPGSISQQYRWNVPVAAQGGQDTVRLTGENAETVPVF